jgi:hypothetical protein
LPNQNDKATEVVVVVDKNLSIRTTNTDAHCLRTKEKGRRSGVRDFTTTVCKVDSNGFFCEVG